MGCQYQRFRVQGSEVGKFLKTSVCEQ